MRNVIDRENLITCGGMNELGHAVQTNTVVDSFYYGRPTRHYATLPGSMESYSEHTQTRTFENHSNLLAYLAN